MELAAKRDFVWESQTMPFDNIFYHLLQRNFN
jgi:hypothetical protein